MGGRGATRRLGAASRARSMYCIDMRTPLTPWSCVWCIFVSSAALPPSRPSKNQTESPRQGLWGSSRSSTNTCLARSRAATGARASKRAARRGARGGRCRNRGRRPTAAHQRCRGSARRASQAGQAVHRQLHTRAQPTTGARSRIVTEPTSRTGTDPSRHATSALRRRSSGARRRPRCDAPTGMSHGSSLPRLHRFAPTYASHPKGDVAWDRSRSRPIRADTGTGSSRSTARSRP